MNTDELTSPSNKQWRTSAACIDLLITAVNDYADLVGVESFTLSPSYSHIKSDVLCHLEDHGRGASAILELENEHAIAVFLGMIAQAQATSKPNRAQSSRI